MEINNEVGLFHADNSDISYVVLQFIHDPQRLIRISMINKTAYELVQRRCRWLIKTAEIIPNSPFGEFTFLHTALWVYVHLVYPIIRAREEFQVDHSQISNKSIKTLNYLTDSKLTSQQYLNHSPLDAVIQYGCPILFEKIVRLRFSKDAKEYTEIAELKSDNPENSSTPENHSEQSLRLTVAEYEVSRALKKESPLTQVIARSRNLNILKHWMTLFPTLLYSEEGCRENVFKIIAMHGSCEMMAYLLEFSPDGILMNDSSETFTIVHYAAQANRVDMLDFLCQSQFNLDVITECGKTPLYVACQSLSLESIQYLLSMKVDLNKTVRIDQCQWYQNTRITPLSRLIFSQYSCDMKNKRSVIVELILAGALLDKCALMTVFDETFTIQGYVINSLFVSGNIELCNARRLIISLTDSLENKSLTIKEVIALTMLCEQFLQASNQFPMRNTVIEKVRKLLADVEKYRIEKHIHYHSTDRHERDESSLVLCV